MKISFTTLACPEWSWETIVDTASRLGYDGIEVRGVQGEMDLTKAYPFLPDTIDQTIEDLQTRGLVICCLDTSCSFHDVSLLSTNIALGKSHIDLAHRLGVPFIRVFGDRVPAESDKKSVMRQITDALKELGTYAEDKGVQVLLETHGDFSRSADVLSMINEAASSNVAVLWDVHHPFRFHGESIVDSWNTLKGYVRVAHLKDSYPTDDNGGHQLVLLGQGNVPIKESVQLMNQEAPEVWLSLEWEKKWHPDIEEPEVAIPQFIGEIKSYLKS